MVTNIRQKVFYSKKFVYFCERINNFANLEHITNGRL